MKSKTDLIMGLGTDIEYVCRFRQLPIQKNKQFYSKIFSEEEIKLCLTRPNPCQSFAARFAAKEAIIKAANPISLSFKDIEVLNKGKAPSAKILKKRFNKLKLKVSISHTEELALAVAMITRS